jgi:ParB/RepB/Spo0J family partition protein
MPTSAEFHHYPLAEISVDRERRHRRELKCLEELAESIARIGLIHPPVITRQGQLISGERRLEAMRSLGWTQAPIQYVDEADPQELQAIELEENIKRMDLSWQEEVLNTARIHEIFEEQDPDWTQEQTAERIGFSQQAVQHRLAIARELRRGNERVQSAAGIRAALNVVDRDRQRAVENEMALLSEGFGETAQESADDNPDLESPGETGQSKADPNRRLSSRPRIRPADQDILCADFLEFASTYEGRRFNLLHCDFPYGINHDRSGQGGSARWGAYSDSPDVYWQLCAALAENLDRLLLPSAHVVFWFSMNYYTETIDFFSRAAPSLEIQPMPLIWHKTDNKGIVSDVERRPRNVVETALFMSRGDRKIIQPVANCYGAPTQKSQSFHISEKPEPMLKHFFRMVVDEMSEVLDPTCGSGSALRAAESMGASRVVGLEQDSEMAESARAELRRHRNLQAAEGLA